MPVPINEMKAALARQDRLIGCWMSFADGGAAEIMGRTGFDWLVIDGEHAPNDIRSVRDQLVALEASPSQPVLRLPSDEVWMIKQALDVGAQTLLIPMVETPEQAAAIVSAMRYPPAGIRGMGASAARASRFGAVQDYAVTANDEVALIVQVETVKGMESLKAIAETPGVDGVFIGPSDLSADMGFPGNPDAPDVQAEMARAAQVITSAGKAAGSLALNEGTAQAYLDMGYSFLAVGIDVALLAQTARALSAKWKT